MKQLLTYQLFVNWRCYGNFAAATWLFSEIWLFTSRARAFKLIPTVTIIENMDCSVIAPCLLEADIQVHIQIALKHIYNIQT